MSASPIYVSGNDSDIEIVDVSENESTPPGSPIAIGSVIHVVETPSGLVFHRRMRQPRIDTVMRNHAAKVQSEHHAAAMEQRARDASLATSTATNPYFAQYLAGAGGLGDGGVMYPDVARCLGFLMPRHAIEICPPSRKRKYSWIANPLENPRPLHDPFDDTEGPCDGEQKGQE